jgi:tRNA (guanine37-N1)-methyltransferase
MVIFLTPQGETLNHSIVRDLHQEKALILICGRYKGIDSRIREKYIDKEISIGDYILSGGEIPAMVLIDSIIRLIPGVLGNEESAECDSFYRGILSPPQYTRPESFEDMNVPNVLLSGHHKKIKEWQQKQAEKITKHRRPDLWEKYTEKMVNK